MLETQTYLILSLILPLIAAGSSAFIRIPNIREAVSIFIALCSFVNVLFILNIFLSGQEVSAQLIEVIPGINIAFSVEPLGMIFALIISFLWIISIIYSIGYMRGNNEASQSRFYAFFAIAISSSLGIAFSSNLFTLFVFYEILTLCTYPLVTHSRTEEAKKSGRIYLGILMGTSVFLLLPAIIYTWNVTGSLEFTPGGILQGKISPVATSILLALYMYGIGKAALMPFHKWLPAAMVAPTPVSALLHAVAVVKAGVFSVVKIIM